MFYHFIKVSSALLLAGLIYFVGIQQGCSPVSFAPVGALSCEEFPEGANCQVKPVFFSCEEKPEQAKCRRPEAPKTTEREKPKEKGSVREKTPKPAPSPPPPPQHYCEISHELSLGKLDILFVVDNSSSMAEEHRSLAQQFSSFLNDIKDVDYHIAVITTDISASPGNLNRNQYYQDGRFIPIGNRKYLRNENLGGRPSQQIVADFRKAIEREETKRCDMRNQPQEAEDKYDRLYQRKQESIACPSSDERGTYAINLAIENPVHRSFFRPSAHFMMLVLTDEDIRSGAEYINQYGFEHYQLEAYDEPEFLVENISKRFPKTKTFNFFSIIIPPGDSSCLAEQNRNRARGSGSGRGYYGREYARLSSASGDLKSYGNLLEGGIISICSRNYGHQLKRVAVSAQTSRVPLACAQPDSIDLYVNNSRVISERKIEGRTLIIRPRRDIPLSSRLKVVEVCALAPGQKCEDI